MIGGGGGFRFGAVWGRLSLVELDYGAVWCRVFLKAGGRAGVVVLCRVNWLGRGRVGYG